MSWTALVVTGTVIFLGIYDLVAVTLWGVDGSISRFVQVSGYNSPVVVLMIGFLLGHFFGYMPPKEKKNVRKQEETEHTIG